MKVAVAATGVGLHTVRGRHPLTATMLQPALRMPRLAIRLAGTKLSRRLTVAPGATHSLHEQYQGVYPLISRTLIAGAPTFASTPRFPIQPAVEGLQIRRLFTSTSNISARHLRSDDRRYQRIIPNRPLVGINRDHLPRKTRKANPFLPFQASSVADTLINTIVGVGISGFFQYEHVELKRS